MSDLERTTSWDGMEIIEEADDIKAEAEAKAKADNKDNSNADEDNGKTDSVNGLGTAGSNGEGGNNSSGDSGSNSDKEKTKKPVKRKLTEQEKRLERQKRRKQSRMIALSVFAAVVILAVIGAVVGTKAIKRNEEAKVEQELSEQELPPVEEEVPIVDMTPVITEEAEPEPVPEEEVQEPEQTEEELLEEMVVNMISEMTLEEKVAGLFIITPESLTGQSKVTKAGDGTKAALEKYPVGGIVYFKQNITSADQVKEMIDNTKAYCRYPMFIAVDEEGGDVARVQQGLKLDKTSTAEELGIENNTVTTFDTYSAIGNYLTEYGFNLDFAPVGDVLTNPDNQAIGNRSFSSDAEVVSNMVVSAIGGLHDSGMYTCVKHFPGQGNADADTHQTLANTDRTRADMDSCELLPFKAAIENGVDMIMIGHLSAPELMEESLPCSLSKEVITDLLRGEMGYNGVVITDSMSMAAISEYYGPDEAAIKALKAGADMVLMPENFETAYQGVIDAVNDGTIDEQRINDSLARVYKLKYRETLQTEE